MAMPVISVPVLLVTLTWTDPAPACAEELPDEPVSESAWGLPLCAAVEILEPQPDKTIPQSAMVTMTAITCVSLP